MAFTLKNLIYSKCIENMGLHQKLIYITDSNTWVEDLIDLILEMQNKDEIEGLHNIITELKNENTELENENEELKRNLYDLKEKINEIEEEVLEEMSKEKPLPEVFLVGDIECRGIPCIG